MIFRPELVEKILSGEKTETRRPVRYGEDGRALPCRYRVGRDYALQPGRTKPGISGVRLPVTSVHRERLGQMNDAKAACEGFAAAWTFLDYWRRMYPKAKANDRVWVIRFELVR